MIWLHRLPLWLFGLVLFSTGCTDGYPTKSPDIPASSADMTQEQRMQRLNEMGLSTSPNRRWYYTLAPGCQLQIGYEERWLFARRQMVSVPLSGTDIRIEVLEGGEKLYRVIGLRSPEGQAQVQDPHTVLHDQGRWPDAIQFRALLTHLQRDCRTSGSAL